MTSIEPNSGTRVACVAESHSALLRGAEQFISEGTLASMNVAPARAGTPETAKPLLSLATEVAPPLNFETPVKAKTAAAASSPPTQSASAPPVKPDYPPPAEVPTQEGPKGGLRFDFNGGCRVLLPESEHPWKVWLRDLDTGNVLFETELKSGRINRPKRYYVRFR